jgi:hypothetical protein
MNTEQKDLTIYESIQFFDSIIQQAIKLNLSNFDLQNLEKIKNRMVKAYMKKNAVKK